MLLSSYRFHFSVCIQTSRCINSSWSRPYHTLPMLSVWKFLFSTLGFLGKHSKTSNAKGVCYMMHHNVDISINVLEQYHIRFSRMSSSCGLFRHVPLDLVQFQHFIGNQNIHYCSCWEQLISSAPISCTWLLNKIPFPRPLFLFRVTFFKVTFQA